MHMRRLLSTTLLAALLCTAPGCVLSRDNQNEPIQRAALDSLQPGTTTASEAVALLGAPSEVVQLGFRSAYRYEFASTKRAALFLLVVFLSNSDARSDRLWLFFDEKDVLSHVGATYSAEDARYAMPWQDD
jgi:hypothetical protein